MATTTPEQEIEELEQRFWKALQDHDVDESVRLTDFPLLLTGAQGASRIEQDAFVKMSHEATWDIHDFEISKVEVIMPAKDVALIAYHVREDLTTKGERVSFEAADSSVWVRRSGQWKCAMHTEALLGDPFGRDRKEA
jgi:hypothetical protein